MKYSRRQTKNAYYANNEYPESNFTPYLCHWNRHTVMTKDKELLQVIKVNGFSFETADDGDLDMRKNVRNSLYRSIASGNYALYFHTIRRRQAASIDGVQPPGFAKVVHDKWMEKHKAHDSFVNDLYITVIRKHDKKGLAIVEHMFTSIAQQADQLAWEKATKTGYKDMTDVTNRILSTLREYQPQLLSVVETPTGHYSELLQFLGTILNGGHSTPLMVPNMDIAKFLPSHRLYFGPRAIEIRGPSKSRFASIVSIKEYAPNTSAGMMDSFLQLPFEFIISQSFSFENRQNAIMSMQNQQRRMVASGDVAVSQVAEINNALDLAMSGHIGFGSHHFSILCLADDIQEVEKNTSLAASELVNCGIVPIRETLNLQAAYWGQMPANFGYVARKSIINTLNLSSLASLHNYPVGRKKGNHWGDAVTLFDTTSGTPYFFNFHVRDVGHTTIIGPTGAGKTVLMNFLCTQAQKFSARTFFFDKDRGADIFIRALGGNYTIIDPSRQTNFNPLQLPDNGETRSFLVDWFKSLVTINGEDFSVQDLEKVNEAINGNFTLNFADRTLSNVLPFFGLEGGGSIASRIKIWTGKESHGKLFDNPEDTIDFTQSRIFGFEMGEVLRDKLSLGPVLLYLFHKISMALDGTPTMIILDEAWALIDNPFFAPKIKDWLKTLRKLNAMVVFATQSVEDASKSQISDTLIQQTSTQIFLVNPKATDEYRRTFMLSEREFGLIKNTDPTSRFFLVKQASEVVVARIDLAGMGDVVSVLSGRADTVRVLDQIRSEVGDDPADWLPVFYERVKTLQ